MMHDFFNYLWYRKNPFYWLLLPFSAIYLFASWVRKLYLQKYKQVRFSVPIIVVGNLTVGGAGKTPLVIAIVEALQDRSLKVAVVSRGYGAKGQFPRLVQLEDNAIDVGDEPLLIKKKTGCLVVVSPRRVDAVQYLLQREKVDIIVADDGMQHYALGRTVEIAVIDGMRKLGNGKIFPAGPLREKKSRLKTVDFVVVNSGEWPNAFRMNLKNEAIKTLLTDEMVDKNNLKDEIAAVAAIGNPERFFESLRALKIKFNAYTFSDHYAFSKKDFIFNEKKIIMTEKDAVKCKTFATENMYYLPVKAQLEADFWDALWQHKQLKEVTLR